MEWSGSPYPNNPGINSQKKSLDVDHRQTDDRLPNTLYVIENVCYFKPVLAQHRFIINKRINIGCII